MFLKHIGGYNISNKLLLLVTIILFVIVSNNINNNGGGLNAFYMSKDELVRLKQRDNAEIANKLEFFFDDSLPDADAADENRKDRIVLDEEQNGKRKFPDTFHVKLNTFNETHILKFTKIERKPNENRPNVYTIDTKTNTPYKYMDGNAGADEFELYKQQNGKGIATLIRNKYWRGIISPDKRSNQPFRMLGTIFRDESSQQSISLDIIPIHKNPNPPKAKRNAAFNSNPDESQQRSSQTTRDLLDDLKIDGNFGFDDENESYAVFKRDMPHDGTHDESTKRNVEEILKRPINRYKRSVNGAPTQLYVETLLVTEASIYNNVQQFTGVTLQNATFAFMEIYYTHFMNAVNLRFSNALGSDPDLRIQLTITNFLFLTNTPNWANASIVGDSAYPKYNGKDVLVAQPMLDAFTKYMHAQSLPSYDFGIGLVDKDIWSSLSGTPANRSLTYSFSYIGQICSPYYSYSVAEEPGGFSNIDVIAQEAGKILGSYYDGDNQPLASACSASSNYIMTPILGVLTTNLQNTFTFSICSVNQFKNVLLTNFNTAVSGKASCLTNTPTVQTNASVNLYGLLPGQQFSADDQCKMKYGPTASFCHALNSTMCVSLSCRNSSTATTCTAVPGFGAAQGTTCGSAQICSNGACISSTLAPTSTCVFGDDMIVNNTIIPDPLPYVQMSCSDVVLYLLSVGKTPFYYCMNNTAFQYACCETCQVYNQKFSCVDKYASCGNYSAFCDDLIKTIEAMPVNVACARTCGVCQQTLKCTDQLCQHGATCLDVPSTPNPLISFACQCPTGYTGLFCENMDPCANSPCNNGGTCYDFGSMGYYCLCTASYTGQNCSSLVATTTLATTISGQTTTLGTTTLPADLCSSSPCVNGICFQLSSTVYYCSCYANYSGNYCQYVSPCAVNPCINGGTCFPQFTSNSYYCFCPPGFTGSLCDIDLRRQCQYNNGNCQNGATCFVDSVTFQAQCNCPPLFTGQRCDGPINPCFSSSGYPVCINGNCAVNTQSAPYYTCTCYSGYSGTNCQLSSNTTPNPQNCVDSDTKLCLIYAQNGYCGSSLIVNGVTVDILCPKSCNSCSTTTAVTTTQSATCVDSDPGCSYWSYYCSLLASINPHPCRKTCGIC